MKALDEYFLMVVSTLLLNKVNVFAIFVFLGMQFACMWTNWNCLGACLFCLLACLLVLSIVCCICFVLFVYLNYLIVCILVSLFARLNVTCLIARLLICLLIYLRACLFASQIACFLGGSLFVCLLVCLFTCLFVFLFTCLLAFFLACFFVCCFLVDRTSAFCICRDFLWFPLVLLLFSAPCRATEDLNLSVLRCYLLTRHYCAAIMWSAGIKPAEPHCTLKTIQIMREIIESPVRNADGSGAMLVIRIPSVELANLAFENLKSTRDRWVFSLTMFS